MTADKRGLILTLTGAPGNGKSEVAYMIQSKLLKGGVKTVFLNDYVFMLDWVENHKGQENLVCHDESGSWWLTPDGYREISPYVARELGKAIRQAFDDGTEVVICEGARGAWGADEYARDYFEPMLDEIGGECDLLNFEMETDRGTAQERTLLRFNNDHDSPPPDIYERYYQPGYTHTWFSSVHDVAMNRGIWEDFGVRVVGNEKINNNYNLDSLRILVEGKMPTIWEGVDMMRSRKLEGVGFISKERK